MKNNCVGGPCQNGGVCQNQLDGFSCVCPTGFTGATCATSDLCAASGLCDPNAACQNGVGTYTCAYNPGYVGDGATCIAAETYPMVTVTRGPSVQVTFSMVLPTDSFFLVTNSDTAENYPIPSSRRTQFVLPGAYGLADLQILGFYNGVLGVEILDIPPS